MKRFFIGVLVITRGDRPKFLAHSKYLMDQQTIQPDIIEIVDDKPLSDKVDITYRYRIGCERLFKKGADVIIFIEDDDFYRNDYIELMVKNWLENGAPELFGLSTTIYYNLMTNMYTHLSHPGRASMMSTMISKQAKIEWGEDSYAYTDMILWKQLKGVAVKLNETIAIGIKHGIGLCGGGGHTLNWGAYNLHDATKEFLRSNVDQKSFEFYAGIKHQIEIKKHHKKPFLSIVTRKYKRPNGFSKNQESIESLTNKEIEQIFITDPVGYGMLEANQSFEYVKNAVSGKYVFLLDDDDFIVNPEMVSELKEIAKEFNNPDVIVFKMLIKNANNCDYPTNDVWSSKKPIAGSIGGSCFVVTKEIYNKFIHHFGKQRMGDFSFINEVFNSGIRSHWYDCRMSETGKVSRGAKE
ncbi:MAG: hypothetical protein V4549_18165 [Bacteroidota bacterium]